MKKSQKGAKPPQFNRDALQECVYGWHQTATVSEADNDKAWYCLEALLYAAKRQIPYADPRRNSGSYRYLRPLCEARQALLNARFDIACERLYCVVSLPEIVEQRILINVIALLEECLDVV